MKNKMLIGIIAVFGFETIQAFSDSPIYVDLDMFGRQSSEVTEPNFTAWPVANAESDSKSINGISFKLSKGSSGSKLRSTYYKTGVQSPYYAKLVCDGVYVEDDGTEIILSISGLSFGNHTLLVYLNNVSGNAAGTVTVSVNGTKKATVTPTSRSLTTAEAATAYVSFFGTSATITFSGSNLNVNGFVLDGSNPNTSAQSPSPADLDDHAAVDKGKLTLSWAAAKNGAESHSLYIGTDSLSVVNATEKSGEFKGMLTETKYDLFGVYGLNTYYWRVDEIDNSGKTNKGNVWRFRPGQLAFDGAEGYGRLARGGRGGKVVYVTNLNDSGEGSLRAAISDTTLGPRTIVFKVSGIIELKSRLVLSSPYVTVAGQTAPGKGITIKGAPFGTTGHDNIVRFLRVRRGYGDAARGLDGMGMTGGENSILDHNSISWTTDEAFSARGAKNITLQRTLISEALNDADHPNYPSGTRHGYAGTISGKTGSYHHNLLAHCEGRNWSMGDPIDGNGTWASKLDIFNNVVYNYGGRATDGEVHQVNFVNNYYKKGPATTIDYILTIDIKNYGTGTEQGYYHGNIISTKEGNLLNDGTNSTYGRRINLQSGLSEPDYQVFVDKPFFESYAVIQSAKQAYKSVLSDVGANIPFFDNHDQRIINETKNGTTTYRGSKTGILGLPDRESDVGGYENYGKVSWAADYDTDMNGLPDWWEKMFNVTDPNADPLKTGYTELERFLDWMATPNYKIEAGETQIIDLANFTAGYDGGTYMVASKPSGVNTTINGSKMSVSLTDTFGGIGYIKFSLKDKDGDTYIRRIGIRGNKAAKSSATEFFTAHIIAEISGNSSSDEGYSFSSSEFLMSSSSSDSGKTDLSQDKKLSTINEIKLIVGDKALHITGVFGPTTIRLYSMNGKQPMADKTVYANKTATLDLALFGAGIYMAIVKNAGKTKSKKFIRN